MINRVAAALTLLVTLSGVADAASLVAWWKLDETTGTALADSSGRGQTLTLVGSNTLGASAAPTRFGNPTAITFGGSSTYASGSATAIPAVNAAVSVSAWFKWAGTPAATGEIFCLSAAGAQQYRLAIKTGAGGTIELDKNSAQLTAATAVGMVSGVWYHVAVTYNGTNDRIYFQGNQIASGSVAHDSASTATVFIGARNTTSEQFAGTLDDIRIFDFALSAAQVAGLAAGGPEDHGQWVGSP